MKRKQIIKALSIVTALMTFIGITACTSVNEKVGGALKLNTDLALRVVVDADVNPDESDQPSPVYVRLYELSDAKLFERADFIDLYQNDEEVLGATLVAKQKLDRLVPGKNRDEAFVLGKETRFVGVFVEYFRYKDAKAKVVFPVTANNVVGNKIAVKLSGNTIKLVNY